MESAIELSARRARGTRAEGARNPKLNFVRSRGVSRRSRRGGMWVRGRGAHLTAERPMTAGLFPSTRTRTKRDGVKTVLQNGELTGWGPNRKASGEDFYRRTAQPIRVERNASVPASPFWRAKLSSSGELRHQQPSFFCGEVERSRPDRPTICRVSSTLDVAEASLRCQNSRRGRPTRA